MKLRVLAVVGVLQLACCLPIVDPGLFVIMGVHSCRAGTGYCLLGLDCTLDEDFLPDDQGGHCDGLRSAFTPSAHFICCRYNAANRTISPETGPLSTPMSTGQEMTDNDLGLFNDYTKTDAGGTDSEDYGASIFPDAESSEGNFMQDAEISVGEMSDLYSGSSASTETNFQTDEVSWSLSTSNSVITTAIDGDRSDQDSAVKVTEGAGFVTQDDASEFTSYATEMSTDSNTAIVTSTDMSRSVHTAETVITESVGEEYTMETSVTQFPSHSPDHISGEYAAVKSSGDTGDRVHSDGVGDSSWKNKSIQPRSETDRMPLIVLTDQGIMKAYPSVVRAETEILVHDNTTGLRNAEVQNLGVTTNETVTQVREHETKSSDGDDRWTTNDVAELKTSVAISELSGVEELPADVDNVAATITGSVSGIAITSLTPPDQWFGDATTNTEIKSVKLYGDRQVLQDLDQNSFVNTNEFAGSQTDPSTLLLPTDLAHSLLTTTFTPMSTTHNSEVPRDEIINNVSSELKSIDVQQFPVVHLNDVTERTGQVSLTQISYKDMTGTNLKTVPFDLDRTNTLFQPSTTGSELFENTMKVPEMANEIPVTITAKLPLLGTVTTMYRQTVTFSGKNHGTKTWPKPLHKESSNIHVVPTSKNKDMATSVMPKTTEDTNLGVQSTNTEQFTAEGFAGAQLVLGTTTVTLEPDGLQTESISAQSNQLFTSQTITEQLEILASEQPNEITTQSFPSNIEMSEKQQEIEKNEGSYVPPGTEEAGELRSGDETEKKTVLFVDSDSSLEDVTEVISTTSTVISSEIPALSAGTAMLSVASNTIGTSSSSSTTDSSNPSVEVQSANLRNSIVAVSSVATQHSSGPSSLCSHETSNNLQGTECWLVQFLAPYGSNDSICVGSYVDSNTIVTSANCVSRVFDIGMTQVTLLSTGGAVTPHTMIRDIIVHEEFRNKGVKLLLNDIGLLRLEPGSQIPPAACALCLPKSDQELMDRPCSQTSWDPVKREADIQIGSPMVCSGGMLAGVLSHHNPHPVYTPISDYVSWIRNNQNTPDYADNEWR